MPLIVGKRRSKRMRPGVGPCAKGRSLRRNARASGPSGYSPELDIPATLFRCPLNKIGIRGTVLDQRMDFAVITISALSPVYSQMPCIEEGAGSFYSGRNRRRIGGRRIAHEVHSEPALSREDTGECATAGESLQAAIFNEDTIRRDAMLLLCSLFRDVLPG